ncbi:hypothetical protein C441_04009 [Haloferax sulfurifontis ATCC BAA-897]|uniref:Uncharacterized protein n=2 Tax=Haloferax sulfurifontis TaxID=255616 RepID=M0IMH3_9EURY|nr:hypothetical protein C441_04009 [Haloferax sulfurifontis ATCC BAA-897]
MFLGLVSGGAIIVTRFSTLTIGTVSIRTSFVGGVLAGLLLLPSVVSHYKGGEQRKSLQWGLFAAGILLSLMDHALLPWFGALAVIGSLGVGWEVDRRLFEETSV